MRPLSPEDSPLTAGKGKHLSRVKVVQRCAKVAFIARLTSPLTFGKSVFSSRVRNVMLTDLDESVRQQ